MAEAARDLCHPSSPLTGWTTSELYIITKTGDSDSQTATAADEIASVFTEAVAKYLVMKPRS